MARVTWHLFFLHIFLILPAFVWAEVLLLRRQESNFSSRVELSCFYNGPQTESVGLGWVLPNADKLVAETQERWRHTSRAGLVKGHFEYYGHIWQSTTALMVKPNVYPAVLDERWNEFPTIFTAGSVEFSKPVFFSTDRIHLSVLARSDAHIALHSSSSPYNSSTYWISLDENVNSVSRSSIRKCLRGLPRSLLPRFADCLLIRVGHQGLDVLRSGSEWVHFTIQLIKEEQSLTIKVKKAHANDNTAHILSTLTWTDSNPIRDFRYISFRTKDTPGRWKIHDYRLVIHNGKADGEGFNVFQLSLPYQCCLQLYYFFRPDMGTAVVSSKDGKQVINLPPTNGTWRTMKVNMAMFPPSDHIHFKPPLGNFDATGPAFAISQPFRICGDEEFFVSKIIAEPGELKGTKCMNLKTSDYAVLNNEISQSYTGPACPENRFSKSCNITCGRVVGDSTCSGKVVCDKNSCSCTSKYLATTQWNTTCTEKIPSDVADVPTAVTEVQEVDSEEEAYDDGEGGDESPTTGSPNAAGAEAAQSCAEGRCDQPSKKNTPLIVFSVLSLVLVGAALGAWVWFRRTKSPVVNGIGIRWKGGNRLIGEEEDERA